MDSKLDLKKVYKDLYSPSTKGVSVVDVPPLCYLMVDGQGAPDGEEARQAIQALFPTAYKLKFASKARGQDYAVMPLEGLWWAEDMQDFTAGRRERWKWTYMILQPDFISASEFEAARAEVSQKKDLPALEKVRLERYEEARAAQILHLGPFSEEGPVIQKLHTAIHDLGGQMDGKHHEIYLTDMTRVAPEKLKTVLRQPFRLPPG